MARDPEKKKLYRKQYYLAHKEEEKAAQKRSYWKDSKKAVRKATEYRGAYPDRIKSIKRKSRQKLKDKIDDYNKKYYSENSIKIKVQATKRNRKRLYGISDVEYKELLAKFNNRCGICGTVFSQRGPDIDHIVLKSGAIKVRGLLCSFCNRGLGYFKDNTDWMSNAIAWLSKPI